MAPGGNGAARPGEVWRRAGDFYAVVSQVGSHGRVRLCGGLAGVAFEAQAAIWFSDRLQPALRLFCCSTAGEARLWAVVLAQMCPNGHRAVSCPELARALERVRAVAGIQGGQLSLPFEDEERA